MDDNIGKKFGKRTVKEYLGHSQRGAIYLFECECGELKPLSFAEVKAGRYQSCARCYARESKRKRQELYANKRRIPRQV